MAYGYEGAKVRLVPLDEDKHFENAVRWMNDPMLTEWLSVGDYPITRLAEREWFDARMRGGPNEVCFAIELLDGTHLGFSNLFRVDFRHGIAYSGSLIGAHEHWGQGFGSDAARIRARYAFEVLGLRVLYSSYLAGNVRSERMQHAAGYEVWGRQPGAFWKRGSYRDMVHTALSRERWLSLTS